MAQRVWHVSLHRSIQWHSAGKQDRTLQHEPHARKKMFEGREVWPTESHPGSKQTANRIIRCTCVGSDVFWAFERCRQCQQCQTLWARKSWNCQMASSQMHGAHAEKQSLSTTPPKWKSYRKHNQNTTTQINMTPLNPIWSRVKSPMIHWNTWWIPLVFSMIFSMNSIGIHR
jgi:hypothetical protein